MATRQTNTYYTLGFKEATYGGSVASYASPDIQGNIVFNDEPIVDEINMTNKTAQITETVKESIAGTSRYTITQSGNIVAEYLDGVLEALTGDATSPMTFANTATPDSYELIRLYPDSNYSVGDVYKGCVLQSFSLTGEFNGLWNFEATWWAQEKTSETSCALYTGWAGYDACDFELVPMKFADTSIAALFDTTYGYDTAFSIDLSFEKAFVDPKLMYANSETLESIIVNKVTGTGGFSATYDNGAPQDIADILNGSATEGKMEFSITNGTKTYAFDVLGQILTMPSVDPNNRDLFEFTGTMKIQGYCNAGTYVSPLTVTVT